MKKLILFFIAVFTFTTALQAQQDKKARKLAEKVAIAFSSGIKELDSQHLINGRLKLTAESTSVDPEFEHKSFRSFAAMDRWMKTQENDQGIPWRRSGDKKISCRKGYCDIGLLEGQMMHSHVFLTKMYYGYSKGRIYVKKLYIIYG